MAARELGLRGGTLASVALVGVLAAGGGQALAAVGPSYTAGTSHPRVDPYYPAEGTTGVDVLHYGLNLSWNGDTRRLRGTATIRFRATHLESAVVLDFAAPLDATSVRLDGVARHTTHSGHKLAIETGHLAADSRHTLTITYHGKPKPVTAPTTRRDIPDLGWTVQPTGQAWSMQEPYGAFTWFPVNDQPSDKAFYDISWHTKAAWRAISNGRLVSSTVAGGRRTMHWRLASPTASYLVAVAIGPYHRYRDAGPHGLPIVYWVRDADRDVLPDLRRTPAMIGWLEAHLGRFPFKRIGAVVVPTNSAEETQTMITIGPAVLRERHRGGVVDLLHEYSHQWYGDEVTPNNWKDLWLNESFATYLQMRWEADHGLGSMRQWRRQMSDDDQYLRSKYGPPGDYDRRNFAELDVYYCGARMLDRLHSMLGTMLFAKVLRDWPRRHRFGNGDRRAWINYLDRVTGENLRPFVQRWLNSTSSPS